MSELVRELELLGEDVDWPATPALTPTAAAAARQPRRVRRRLVVAIVLAVLLAAAGALAATGVIHFGGATIKRVERLPPADPVAAMQLGAPIAVPEAERLVPGLRLPPRLRHPDAAYSDARGVSLVYLGASGPRAILGVLREGAPLLEKLVASRTPIRRVAVDGARGLYIADTHVDFLYGPGRRLSRPTLLWQRDGLLYRLESAQALRLASAR